ncbi:LOW QUALITY PROTEIN: hypothetical protein PanWU01x14_232210 [Parasponia andersonii]|uniref:Uncharacterized protein n=1 Tax=Parasponia andersonii TaxID=3476 RepID=A0A2P5BK13_PARAD|nr:LOW QUALITY PROTEIN: hypothetical protein PanWU01x14_232210 [Parasponia andersonii]
MEQQPPSPFPHGYKDVIDERLKAKGFDVRKIGWRLGVCDAMAEHLGNSAWPP